MYTTKNIALISVATALLIAVKYAFGEIAGIEFVTFLIILYGVFLPLAVSSMVTISFVFVTGIMYGMGYWWIMYWFIFPTETILSFSLRKILQKNSLVFASWTGFWGFSIMFWYALQNWVIQGPAVAINSMTTAIVVNSIEGVSNFLVALFAFYPCQRFFKYYFDNREVIFW